MALDKKLIDDAVAEALAAVEPTIRAAVTKAVEKAVERSRNAIVEAQRALSGAIGEPFELVPMVPKSNLNSKQIVRPERSTRPRKNGGYRGVAVAVRQALGQVGRAPGGTDAIVMIKHMKDNSYGPPDITVQQIRSSLTQLIESGEAVRVDRGLYRATDKLLAPN